MWPCHIEFCLALVRGIALYPGMHLSFLRTPEQGRALEAALAAIQVELADALAAQAHTQGKLRSKPVKALYAVRWSGVESLCGTSVLGYGVPLSPIVITDRNNG